MREVAAITAIVVGIIMASAGVLTWVVVSPTLADQKITVSDDARCAAGDGVQRPDLGGTARRTSSIITPR